MLGYSMIFLVCALLAAVFGFWALVGVAATIAKICFGIFLVAWLYTLITGNRHKRTLA